MKELRQAALDGEFVTVKRLCREYKNRVNEPGPETGKTALHWGAFGGHTNVVSYLLKAAMADVDPLDSDSNSPLNLVIQAPGLVLSKKLVIIDILLAHQADPACANGKEKTPLMNLMALRDSVPDSNYHQMKNIDVVIRKMKEILYGKARQSENAIRIGVNGQVLPMAAYPPSVLYVARQSPSFKPIPRLGT